MPPTRPMVLLLMTACSPPPEPPVTTAPPVPTVQLANDWVIVEEDPTRLVLRWRDSADGARITLARTADALPGVSPIVAGRTASLERDGLEVPLFGVPTPDTPLSAATIEVQGPDLLVRLEGPPLSTVSDHPDAPDDPVLTWVRLRRRPDGTWRIVLQGLHVWTLPAAGFSGTHLGRVHHHDTSWGPFLVDRGAPRTRSSLDAVAWTWDSTPSLDALQPYPRTGMTWTPTPPLTP